MGTTVEKTGILMVLTASTQDQIIADSGVFVPRINSEKVMSTCQYLVCVQNNPENSDDENLYAHKEGFLIGTISDVKTTNDHGERLIAFDTYATFQKRNAWQNGGNKMGIAYFDSPSDAKLRVGSYDFVPVPETIPVAKHRKPKDATVEESFETTPKPTMQTITQQLPPMNLIEAKAIIAMAIGVSPDKIEITIKV